MSTTTDTEAAVTIEGYHVAELRKYLARTETGYDTDDRIRAALYVCGYLEACLGKASGRPA